MNGGLYSFGIQESTQLFYGRKTMTQLEKLEHERLFGEGIDIFKNYYAAKFLKGIIKNIGLQEIDDRDFYRTLTLFITTDEAMQVYDRIMPPEKRRKKAESGFSRNPPELEDGDTPGDCLEYIAHNMLQRQKMFTMLLEIFEMRLTEYEKAMENTARTPSATEKRFIEMRKLFDLTQTEMEILLCVFFSDARLFDFGDFSVDKYNSSAKITAIAKMTDSSDTQIAELMDDQHNIRKFGLIDNDGDLDRTFLSYLSGISSRPLSERFWTKFQGDVLPWNFHGRLAEKNGAVLIDMINNKNPANGISVLLYGVAGSGKTSFAASLAASLGKELYFIAQSDEDTRRISYTPAFRYAALAVAQKQLDPQKCILVVDECDKMVENSSLGGGIFAMLGMREPTGSRDGESKGQLNDVIDHNRHTVLWICNSKSDAIDPSSRRRFDYSVFFDELSPGTRKHIWENALKFHHCEGKLSENFLERVSSTWHVNPGGIAIAVKNAALLCAGDPKRTFEHEVMTFLKAHCLLLGIQESPEEKLEPARDYSLEGLNIKGGIRLPRLIEVCKNFLDTMENFDANRDQPRMNILLFGVPGAGKTEFVKYLAKQLGRKLSVKNASDILSMWVGGTEERLAAVFAEAESNGEILFMDEGDSLLGSREGAVRSWEVSQVNTLLAEMERFRGIFIVGTNLIQKLDPAALRRFSFRLHFDYLDNAGKETFYRTYFAPLNLPELSDDERKRLWSIEKLTPSDFRNARQVFFYLKAGELTNDEVLDALAAEVESKNSGSSYTGLGKIASRMGF